MAKLELYPYQKEGVRFLKKHGWRVLLADAPGLGKTPQTLVAVRENIPTLCPVLVVAPSSVLISWSREVKQWVPGAKVQLLNEIRTPIQRGHHFTLIPWDLVFRRIGELKKKKYKLIIADEAHYAKGGVQTKRGRAFAELVESVPHLLLLSGTPIVNTEEELETLQSFYGTRPAPILRRLLEEALPEIPPKRRIRLYCDLPTEIRNEYDMAKAEFGDWLDGYLQKLLDDPQAAASAAERSKSAEPLAKLAYLRRILGRGKALSAAAWVKMMLDKGEPVVVFGMFSDVLDILSQMLAKLDIPFVRLDGSMSRGQRQAAIDAFTEGRVDVFLLSMAGREGITLHRGDVMRKTGAILKQPANLLFLERWYTPAAEEQAEDRIRRLGQKRACLIWYLHATGTIDDRIDDIIENKRGIVRTSIGAADVESITHKSVMDVWRRIPALRDGVPGVAENPDASLDLPEPPDPKYIHAVIFDASRWPIPSVQQYLRQNGIRSRKIHRKGVTVRIECRSIAQFRWETMRKAVVKEGFGLHYGKPNNGTAAERMATLRAWRRSQKQGRQKFHKK